MEEKNITNIIYQFKNEVCYYNQMQLYSMLPSEKNYYINQIEERTQDVIMQILFMEKQDRNPILSNDNNVFDNNNQPISGTSEEPIPGTGEEPIPGTNEEPIPNSMEQKEFTIDELSKFNGMNGNPAYVAVNGTVYDVSNIVLWAGGRHNGLAAGKDLSAAYLGCHLGMPERLEKLTKVGKLKR